MGMKVLYVIVLVSVFIIPIALYILFLAGVIIGEANARTQTFDIGLGIGQLFLVFFWLVVMCLFKYVVPHERYSEPF